MSKPKTPSFTLNSFTDIFSSTAVVTAPSGIPWYETLNCKDSMDMIFEYEEKAQESFIGMGYFLKRIKEKELYRELGYDNMFSFAKEQCHMDESAVSRFIGLCERFSKDNNSPILDTKFKGYSKSQLIEMMSIKDDQTMEKMNPDMTIKQMREAKKEALNEPTDDDIRLFFDEELCHRINIDQWSDLKNYMSKTYKHTYYSCQGLKYDGSPKGITINGSDEITWAKFVNRVYLLEDLVPDCIKNPTKDEKIEELPGQMNIENDFPQYCPEKEMIVVEGDFREISVNSIEEKQNARIEESPLQLGEVSGDKREDVMTKYKCNSCLQEFILGDHATQIIAANNPRCPYCGQKNIEGVIKADPGNMEEMFRMKLMAIFP